METNPNYFSPAPWVIVERFGTYKVFDADEDVIATFAREKDAKLFLHALQAFYMADTMQWRLARHRDRLDDAERADIQKTKDLLALVDLPASDPEVEDDFVEGDWTPRPTVVAQEPNFILDYSKLAKSKGVA